ncbi:cell wall binding repeat 2-containing protein (precursor) [Clostridium botulinum B str. Osaka05]|uniref:Cell wall binding repeat 2-containing protein (Precursor) n=1 Tax=Clostridium botulinum B str. Osaka05 TaxID=1407017 RepID=A0A060N4W6_CLOBO|nr:N-acetylmuramoyl-L-alanine amidase [Clostridium botulinum]BAO04867.1 cell wall binding repeat 2-containing protein (precursor) [Clostridium botulinum B str. Osaka05]
MATSIMGVSQATTNQCEEFLRNINSNAPYLANIYKKYCDIYGIKLEIAWVQMCLETNFLRYSDTSITTLDMHNYAGLGAVDGNGRRQALKFNTEEKGVECHIQHLFAYCSKNSLPQGQKLIDPRFKYVDRGCAINVEDLGGGKWASDKQYANKLLDLLGRLMNTKTEKKGDNVMKIGLRGGHSPNCKGASGYLDEQSCVRELYYKLKPLLEAQGHTVIDCNSNASSVSGELSEGTNKCNSAGCDLYIPLHMNASNGQGNGVECWTYNSNSSTANAIGNRICSNLASLGLQNRGVKHNTGYHDTRAVKGQTCLIEILFCDNKHDSDIWRNAGINKIASLIASAICNKTINTNSSNGNSTPSKPTAVVTASALNIREKKSTSSKILGVLPSGKLVEVYKVEGDWVHIYYPPHGGFISKQYVKLYNIPNSMVQNPSKPVEKKEEKKMDIILYFGETDEYCAGMLRYELKLPVLSLRDFKANPNLKNNTGKVYMVGGSEKPVSNTILITGNKRMDTAQAVVNYIKNIK